MKKIKTYILQWMNNPANRTKKQMAFAVLLLVGLLVSCYTVNRVLVWLHDVNYQYQQNKDKDAANRSESNANQHEANANTAANNLKELEKDEQTIKNQQADQQKILANDKQKAANTRERLNDTLHTVPANRIGNDGIDDDQLRSDSNAARSAFNGQ